MERNLLKREMHPTGETQRMMDRWTVELANWLMSERDMTRREAFLKAHLTRRLLDGLGQGVIVFQYRKENGELRTARGTLCPGISEDFDHYEYKRDDSDAFSRADERGVYVYFDLDRNAFRSFATWRLINVYQDGRGV
jgi:hypothetical protein